jgi:hypothetical protein
MSSKQEQESSQHAEVLANAAAEASKHGADTVRLLLGLRAASSAAAAASAAGTRA